MNRDTRIELLTSAHHALVAEGIAILGALLMLVVAMNTRAIVEVVASWL